MARGSRRRHRTRVVTPNATPVRFKPQSTYPLQTVASTARQARNLALYEDRRTYHPQPQLRPARRITGGFASVAAAPNRHLAKPPSKLRFMDPQRVLICVRRQVRRQVLHALKHAGKSGQRSPRPSWYSSVHCS